MVGTTQLFQTISGWSWVPHNFGVLTTSPYFPSILFGLGAVNLAMNPDGILALFGEQQASRRRRRRSVGTSVAPPPVALPIPTAVNGRTPESAINGAADCDPRGAWPVGAVGEANSTMALADDAPLVLDDIVAGYGDVEVLHGVSVRVRRGRSWRWSGRTGRASPPCARWRPV